MTRASRQTPTPRSRVRVTSRRARVYDEGAKRCQQASNLKLSARLWAPFFLGPNETETSRKSNDFSLQTQWRGGYGDEGAERA